MHARAMCAILVFSLTFAGANARVGAQADTVNVGYALCAHCLSMALTPQFVKGGVTINPIRFTSGTDVFTALIGGSVDVAQVTYLHFIRALDQGIPIVAISGQVNGGSDVLVRKDLPIKANDWNALKSIIAQDKKAGKPFRIAASRGNAQDIDWRGEFKNHGIDPDNDLEFVNIPNPSDDVAALNRGEIDAVSSVEPFASQVRLTHAGNHFSFPYDQDAGKLTNLIVTKPEYAQKHPREVQAVVAAVVGLVGDLKSPHGNQQWLGVIKQNTALDDTVAKSALQNAYPDYTIHLREMLAMARMMHALNYTEHVVSPDEIESHVDYSYLAKATGKPKAQLGYAH
jgi:ABC-type nitrate/sulfonate/bicarbonate transport system substrate-binding protein